VEAFLDKRVSAAGGWEYLVKWLGYAHSENTWEAAKHVVSA